MPRLSSLLRLFFSLLITCTYFAVTGASYTTEMLLRLGMATLTVYILSEILTLDDSSAFTAEEQDDENNTQTATTSTSVHETPKKKPKLYASFDVEADNDSPTVGNMLSIGVAFFDVDGYLHDTFSANLKELPDKVQGERCMNEFWNKNPKLWIAVHKDQQDPSTAMRTLVTKYIDLCKTWEVVWVAAPAAYDFQWLKAYALRFVPDVDIGYSARCASTTFKIYKELLGASAKTWEELADGQEHTHDALEDAIEQGLVFVNVMRELSITI